MTIANFRNWCLDCTNSYLRPIQSVMISQLKLDFLLCLTRSKYCLLSAIILQLSRPIPYNSVNAKTKKCTLVNSKWYNDWIFSFWRNIWSFSLKIVFYCQVYRLAVWKCWYTLKLRKGTWWSGSASIFYLELEHKDILTKSCNQKSQYFQQLCCFVYTILSKTGGSSVTFSSVFVIMGHKGLQI